jgi:DNA-binding MarR family transcriptional regulator
MVGIRSTLKIQMENNQDPTVDFFIRQTWHKISRMYNQQAAEHSMTISTGYIFLIIDKNGTPSTQLGPRMGMEPTSLSRTLKTMEDEGFICRKVDELDKRKVLIFLTEKGLEQRKISKKVVLDFNDKLLSKIPKNKLKVYLEVMVLIDQIAEGELQKLAQ